MRAAPTEQSPNPLIAVLLMLWAILTAMLSIIIGIFSALFGLLMVLITLPLHVLCRAFGFLGFTRHHPDGTIEYAWYKNPFARSA